MKKQYVRFQQSPWNRPTELRLYVSPELRARFGWRHLKTTSEYLERPKALNFSATRDRVANDEQSGGEICGS